jgi:hypothetical protein
MSNVTVPNPTSTDLPAHTREGDKRCAACPHQWAEHDGISARYCAATIVSGSGRGCVCSSDVVTDAP